MEKTALIRKNILAGAIFIVAFFLIFGTAGATTIDELKRSIDQKNAEIKKLEEEAARFRSGIVTSQKLGRTLKEELTRINGLIAQLKRDVTLTERKIEKKNFEIQEVSVHIAEKTASIQKMRLGIAGLIETISKKDHEPVFATLLRNGGLTNFFRELDATALAQDKLLATLGEIKSLKKELEEKKSEAEDRKSELEELEGYLRDQRKMQEGVKQDRTTLLTNTKNQEKKFQELLTDAEKKQQSILQEIEELESELRKRVDPNSLPAGREGFFRKPADGVISQGYGETPFTKSARGRDFYKFHNGVDFAAAYGSPIFAAADGKVIKTGDTDRFCPRAAHGKYVVIDHGNNLATVYGHMSLVKASEEEAVKRGDVIGYIGTSGLTTGPHVHFTVYDSRTLEFRKGATGACGIMPFGGSINPMLYL